MIREINIVEFALFSIRPIKQGLKLNKANKSHSMYRGRNDTWSGFLLLKTREETPLDKVELLIEIGDVLEELKHGAEIGITMGNMGHDTSEDLKMLVVDFLGMKKEELEEKING